MTDQHVGDRRSSEDINRVVRELAVSSAILTAAAGGVGEIDRMLGAISDEWVEASGRSVHLDVHRCDDAKATVVFQPGSGAHSRLYFVLGGLLARRGYAMIGVDRPGHGLSDGDRGDCTVEKALEAARVAIDYARSRSTTPVVLMGSSMGGLLTVFGLLKGLRPHLAVAHNFLFPGKLFSFRMRSRWISRRRTKPYPLVKLVHGFEDLSSDPVIAAYMRERDDPFMAWELTARSVASLFGFNARRVDDAPQTLAISGAKDKAIPAWATRLFMRFSGLPHYDVRVLPETGHLLFHDHLDVSVPVITDWLDARIDERHD